MKSQIQVPNLTRMKTLWLKTVIRLELLNILNICGVGCCNESVRFTFHFSLKCYVGTVMYCMTLYSITCWEILRYAYICVKMSAICVKEDRKKAPFSLWTVEKQKFVASGPFLRWESLSLGVYFIKGHKGFYFSELSNIIYYIYWKERQNYFSSAHSTLFVYVMDINLVF